ncbi:hypothetical protein DNI29_08235 [Hymenobacter sediminis]|uniref:hypothetical protein n=1 Tax=Hymenobacter sediminis TaxID=2218621 RepID=UPI000DA6B5B0|nr:hypothetical protein [Hymenobacter sediminis]RPD48593.1 hypothetical protein DNI29_08235 [Hymenobacter sediminis]
MKAVLAARFACLALVLALLAPSLTAAAGTFGPARYYKGGLHRPVYKKYQPGCRWIFQKR